MAEMALELIAKIFLVLVVLALSIGLITKFYSDAQKIDLVDKSDEGQQTIGPLDSTTSDAVGALASNCYKKYKSDVAKGKENVCYFVYSSDKPFDQMGSGITKDGIISASGLDTSKIEVDSLSTTKLLIVYDLPSDKVIIK